MNTLPRKTGRGFLVAALAAATLSVADGNASAAPLCALDPASHTLAVTGQPGSRVDFRANAGYLDVNGSSCALLNDIDSASVDMSAAIGSVSFDLTGGPLGPGFTDEGTDRARSSSGSRGSPRRRAA
jgi:hypothetical protein